MALPGWSSSFGVPRTRLAQQYSPNLITTLLGGVASAWLFLVRLTG